MNLILILICFLLVFCGAFFFGFPVGMAKGRREMRREMEDFYFPESTEMDEAFAAVELEDFEDAEEIAEFPLIEKIGCIDRQIAFQERVISVFENDDPVEIAKAQKELAILQSIRESLEFDNLMMQAGSAENRPWLEETQC